MTTIVMLPAPPAATPRGGSGVDRGPGGTGTDFAAMLDAAVSHRSRDAASGRTSTTLSGTTSDPAAEEATDPTDPTASADATQPTDPASAAPSARPDVHLVSVGQILQAAAGVLGAGQDAATTSRPAATEGTSGPAVAGSTVQAGSTGGHLAEVIDLASRRSASRGAQGAAGGVVPTQATGSGAVGQATVSGAAGPATTGTAGALAVGSSTVAAPAGAPAATLTTASDAAAKTVGAKAVGATTGAAPDAALSDQPGAGAPAAPTAPAAPAAPAAAAAPAPVTAHVPPFALTPTAHPAATDAAPTVLAPAPVEVPPLATQLGARLAGLRNAPAGEHVLTMRVDPESIGPVRVVAHIGPEGVRIELLGATPQARDALRAALPDLRRDLVAAGLLADLGLGSGDSSPRGQGSSSQAHGFGPGGGNGSRDGRGAPGANRPSTGAAPDPRTAPPTGEQRTERTRGLDLIV